MVIAAGTTSTPRSRRRFLRSGLRNFRASSNTRRAAHPHSSNSQLLTSNSSLSYDYKRLLCETDAVGGAISQTYASDATEEFGDLIGEDGQYVHQYDAQANTNALLDDTGTVQAQYKYLAFGQVSAVSIDGGPWTAEDWESLPLDFTSNMLAGGKKQYYLDQEIALYLLGGGNNGRYYDAATGRFLSEDPTGEAGGDTNLFRYTGNDPVNNLDPSGHKHHNHHVYHPPQTQQHQQHNQSGGWFSGLEHAASATGHAISGASHAAWGATKHAAEATGHAIVSTAKAAWSKAKYGAKVASYLPQSLKHGTAAVGADLATAVTLGQNKYVNEVDKQAWQKTDAGQEIQTASRVFTGISAGAAAAAGGAIAVQAVAAAAPAVAGAARVAGGAVRAVVTNPTVVNTVVKGAPIVASVAAGVSMQPEMSIEAPATQEANAVIHDAKQALPSVSRDLSGETEKATTSLEHEVAPVAKPVTPENAAPRYVPITANGEPVPGYGPKVPYDRSAAYGSTPTAADRAAGLTDHQPPLVQRFYGGDTAAKEPPGFLQNDAERAASAADRSRLKAPAEDYHSQGGKLRQYSLEMRKFFFGY